MLSSALSPAFIQGLYGTSQILPCPPGPRPPGNEAACQGSRAWQSGNLKLGFPTQKPWAASFWAFGEPPRLAHEDASPLRTAGEPSMCHPRANPKLSDAHGGTPTAPGGQQDLTRSRAVPGPSLSYRLRLLTRLAAKGSVFDPRVPPRSQGCLRRDACACYPPAEAAKKLHFRAHLTPRVWKERSGATQPRAGVSQCTESSASSGRLLDYIYYLRSSARC